MTGHQTGEPEKDSRNITSKVIRRLYPEIAAGGFTRNNHRVIFFARVNALLQKEMTVLEFGAGRGKWDELESGFKLALTTLKGKCHKVIGADLDPTVLSNPLVDEAIVLPQDGSIPLDDMSIDMVVSYAVFEHLTDPAITAAELHRILRPGGWICAATPNKWGYVSVGARLIPHRFHRRVLRRVQPTTMRRENDVFPTVYKLNTLRDMRRYFPLQNYEHFSYRFSGAPSYYANNFLVAVILDTVAKLAPNYFASSLHVFIRKR